LFNDIKNLQFGSEMKKNLKMFDDKYRSMVDVSTLQQSQLELGSIVGPEGRWFQVKVSRTGSETGLQ